MKNDGTIFMEESFRNEALSRENDVRCREIFIRQNNNKTIFTNNIIQDIINQTIEEIPMPKMHAIAYTADEVRNLINKDRNNLQWAMIGKLRNKYAGL